MFHTITPTRITMSVAALAIALTSAGCSGAAMSTSSTPTTFSSTEMPGMPGMPGMNHGAATASSAPGGMRTDFNDADVTFLDMMYPHHAQAIDMATMVPGKAQNRQLITLADNIKKAQGPEMDQMTGLLASFGKPAPTKDLGHDMPGMMTSGQMNTLEGLSGTSFDHLWLQMMIDHHTGAITMADTEIRDGTNSDVKKMAQAIIANQQAEIAQMRGMLGQP